VFVRQPGHYVERGSVGVGRCSAPVAVNEAHDSADDVPDAAGEILVGSGDETFDGEVGVGDLGDVAAEPPAQDVGAVGRRDEWGRCVCRVDFDSLSCPRVR